MRFYNKQLLQPCYDKTLKRNIREMCMCFGEMNGFLSGSYITVVVMISQIQISFRIYDMDYLALLHTHYLFLCLQLKAPAPQTSSSARPPCTAFPNSGFVMRTLTVQTGQMRLIAVSCGNPLNHKSHHHFTCFSVKVGRI